MTESNVDWALYAQSYDLLLSHNPYYQSLHADVLERCRKWSPPDDGLLLDLGAGTGNYSIPLADLFPRGRVLHVEPNEGMNGRTRDKLGGEEAGDNLEIRPVRAEALELDEGSLAGCVCVHAFYTFEDPQEILRRLYRWMAPGAEAVLVDAGRRVNVLSWQLAIGWHLFKTQGFRRSLEIMRSGKEVSRQNAYIREQQDKGVYWVHSHDEFLEAIRSAGFEVIDAKITFRGVSDFVVARKGG